MAKSKRKTSTPKEGVSTKKKRDDTSCAQHSGLGFDDLCDNTLLRILSYTDDLRSLINLTRCTSKSLRKRFDLKGDKNAPEYSKLYKKFWQGVFADLQMAPLEGSDKSHDYIAAINYRISLFHTLVGHDERRKAGTSRSYSLPLRHYYFKPFDSIWHYYGDDDDGSGAQTEFMSPFSLLTGGTGQEYVFVDPDLGSVDVHSSLLERVQCLDKSIQKKRETAQRAVASARLRIKPTQTLLRSCRDSIKEGSGLLKWEDYFGNNTPFGPYNVLPPEFSRRIYVEEVALKAFDSMDEDGVHLDEKVILFTRLIRDQDGRKCTEYILWGDIGHKERSPSKRFIKKTILRIPAGVIEDVVTMKGNKLYTQLIDGDSDLHICTK